MFAVGGKVAGAHELEAVARLGVVQALLQLGMGDDRHTLGVNVAIMTRLYYTLAYRQCEVYLI